MENYYLIGHIVKPHGLNGDVKVLSETDFKEERFKLGSQLALFDGDNLQETVTVSSWRYQKPYDILHFEEFQSIDAVVSLKGMSLQVAADQRHDHLDDDSFYYDDIIGLTVQNLDGQSVGKITSILSPGANDVWVMERADNHQEVLIPYIKDVVKSVDIASGTTTVDFIEGLLDDED
ncbi:MAG: ribosome maturation factor RimM [Aerococcus sp.]|nr:ribosome maturation factor RimM [Aerococcus sp.]